MHADLVAVLSYLRDKDDLNKFVPNTEMLQHFHRGVICMAYDEQLVEERRLPDGNYGVRLTILGEKAIDDHRSSQLKTDEMMHPMEYIKQAILNRAKPNG